MIAMTQKVLFSSYGLKKREREKKGIVGCNRITTALLSIQSVIFYGRATAQSVCPEALTTETGVPS
jgi:hypothetical protein